MLSCVCVWKSGAYTRYLLGVIVIVQKYFWIETILWRRMAVEYRLYWVWVGWREINHIVRILCIHSRHPMQEHHLYSIYKNWNKNIEFSNWITNIWIYLWQGIAGAESCQWRELFWQMEWWKRRGRKFLFSSGLRSRWCVGEEKILSPPTFCPRALR